MRIKLARVQGMIAEKPETRTSECWKSVASYEIQIAGSQHMQPSGLAIIRDAHRDPLGGRRSIPRSISTGISWSVWQEPEVRAQVDTRRFAAQGSAHLKWWPGSRPGRQNAALEHGNGSRMIWLQGGGEAMV